MVTKQEKLHHKREVQIAIAGLVILFIVFLGVQTVENFVNFGVALGLETINESIEMFFLDQFAQFGILVVAGYHLIPTTFWVLGITGVVVRILDLGFSPFLLVLIVAAARVTAYYNEALARDIAKMLPFALLGVFIIERTLISPDAIWQNILALPSHIPTVLSYALFTVIIEFVLRIYWELFHLFSGRFEKELN